MDLHSIPESAKVTDILNKVGKCIATIEINKPISESSKAGEHLIKPTITSLSR